MNDQDLQNRLARAGEHYRRHPGELPDLDAVLDAARHEQHRHRVWFTTAAAAIGVVGVVVAVQLTGHDRNRPSTAQSSVQTPPTSIQHSGKTLTYVGEEVWSKPVLDESNANKVIVYADVNGGTSKWGEYCGTGTTAVARVVSQNATAVRIAVAKYAVGMTNNGPIACADTFRLPVPLTVTLAQPLGDRPLIDATHDVPRKVLDPKTVLKPTDVPTGYTGGQATWATVRTAIAQRNYNGPGGKITLTTGSAALNSPLRHIIKHTTIRGHSATVSYEFRFPYDIQIAWNEDRTHAVTLYQTSAHQDASHAALTAEQLIKIANSIR